MDVRNARSRRSGRGGRRNGRILTVIRMNGTAIGRERGSGNGWIRWLRMRRCGQSRGGGRGGVF
jgi:hypothetical protein